MLFFDRFMDGVLPSVVFLVISSVVAVTLALEVSFVFMNAFDESTLVEIVVFSREDDPDSVMAKSFLSPPDSFLASFNTPLVMLVVGVSVTLDDAVLSLVFPEAVKF